MIDFPCTYYVSIQRFKPAIYKDIYMFFSETAVTMGEGARETTDKRDKKYADIAKVIAGRFHYHDDQQQQNAHTADEETETKR